MLQFKTHLGIFLLMYIGFYLFWMIEENTLPSMLGIANGTLIVFGILELILWIIYFCFVK